MTRRNDKRGAAARPSDPDGWIKARDASTPRGGAAAASTAKPSIDVTPAMRPRITVAAFSRGTTAADMLRKSLACEFADTSGERS